MNKRWPGWVLMLGWWASAACAAPDGRRLISQADIPLTVTNAGSYLVTENLTLRNGVLIPAASVWKYRDNGSNQGTAWRAIAFDDSTWPSGRAELGYGDNGMEATTVSYGANASGKYVTTYFRCAFALTNAPAYTDLDLYVRRDDGVVVYLNGTEVARDNMPTGTPAYTTLASGEIADARDSTGDLEAEYLGFDVPQALLVTGTNVVAVEVHIAAANTPDISFDLALFGAVAGASGTRVNGITIAAANVTLDLNGHTLTGVELGSDDGIQVASGVNVTIRNGTVTEWGDDGIDALNTTNCRIEDIRAVRNFRTGIQGGMACLVRNCAAYANGMTRTAWESGDGIRAEEGSIIRGCIARQNYNHAISAGSACDIANCVVTRNGHDGLHAGQGTIASRFIAASSLLTAAGKRGDGIEINIGGIAMDACCSRMDDGMKTREETDQDGRAVFLRCTAYSNFNDGIKSQEGAIITQCAAVDNGDDGINVQNQSVVIGNSSCGNGFFAGGTAGGGVTMEGSLNRGQDNHLMGNENGIRADPASTAQRNLIVGNSAAGNLQDYLISSANNVTGPRTNAPSRASAWANFDF